jgi:hypothetical protein
MFMEGVHEPELIHGSQHTTSAASAPLATVEVAVDKSTSGVNYYKAVDTGMSYRDNKHHNSGYRIDRKKHC